MQEFRADTVNNGFLRRRVLPPAWLNAIFSDVKSDGVRLRWLMGMKKANLQPIKTRFKMKTIRDLGRSLPQDAWMTSRDYSTYFWLFSVDREWEAMQCTLMPEPDGRWRQYSQPVASMGCLQSPIKTAPHAKMVSAKMAEFGVAIFVYCDEGLQYHRNEAWSYISHLVVLVLTTLLGLIRSVPKDKGIPARLLPFLGWLIAPDVLRPGATRLRFEQMRAAALEMYRAAVARDPDGSRQRIPIRAKA